MILPLLLLAEAAAAPQPNCADPMSLGESRLCAQAQATAAQVELDRQWDLTSEALRKQDREEIGKWDRRSSYHEALVEAQEAWRRYRAAHCTGEGYLARGGSMERLLVSLCYAELTKARTDQLRRLVEGYEE